MSLANAEETRMHSAVAWMAVSHLNKNKEKQKRCFLFSRKLALARVL